MKNICYLCGSTDTMLLKAVSAPPRGEQRYQAGRYYREIHRCCNCNVFLNFHQLLDAQFYEGRYNQCIPEKLAERFERIVALSFAESDNKQRVERIVSFVDEYVSTAGRVRVLDVGTGTGVFPFEMHRRGFRVFCVDPDKAAIDHVLARKCVEDAFVGSIESVPDGMQFHVITFNKVLEHVRDPVSLLAGASALLSPGAGFVYIELPEGERSYAEGVYPVRQEFFAEHLMVFNLPSVEVLARAAGFALVKSFVFDDPSGKRSLCAFLNGATGTVSSTHEE